MEIEEVLYKAKEYARHSKRRNADIPEREDWVAFDNFKSLATEDGNIKLDDYEEFITSLAKILNLV